MRYKNNMLDRHKASSMSGLARITLLPLCAAGMAAAQVPTSPPDAGRILQQSSQSVPQSPATAVLKVPEVVEAGEAAPTVDGPTVRIQQLALEGLDDASLQRALEQKVLSDWREKDVNLSGLRQIATQVQSLLRTAGYPFARAFVPVQTLEAGRLQIRTVLGRYGAVSTNEASAQRWLHNLVPGEPITSRELERSLGILAELPGVVSDATLSASKQEGAGDLAVAVTIPQRYRGEVGVDNSGNRYSGYYKLRVGLDAFSQMQFGDHFSVRGSLSEQKSSLGSVAYALPLGTSGLRLGLNYSVSDYELGREFVALQANGTAKALEVQLNYPVVLRQALRIRTVASYSTKSLQDRRDSVNVVENKKSKLFTLGVAFDRRDERSTTSGQVASVHGKLDMDTALSAADAASVQTGGSFRKVTMDLSHVHRVSALPVMGFARWSAQRASKNLDSSEKFSLGGASGVRAWPTGEGSGDEGDLLQLELRLQASELEPFVFWDAGRVKLNKQALPAVAINSRSIAGAGLGLRWSNPNWRAEASLGRTTRGGASQSEPGADSTLLRFSLMLRF